MKELFVTQEIATQLKELGFDEPCLAFYSKEDVYLDENQNKTNFCLLSAKKYGELVGHGSVKNYLFNWLKENDKTSGELYTLSESVTAPLIEQAFTWFETTHNLHITFSPRSWDTNIIKWSFWCNDLKNHNFHIRIDERDTNLYDSKLEALKEALKGLIIFLKIGAGKCYCGNPIDTTNPDCVEFNLCKDHAEDV